MPAKLGITLSPPKSMTHRQFNYGTKNQITVKMDDNPQATLTLNGTFKSDGDEALG